MVQIKEYTVKMKMLSSTKCFHSCIE